MANTKIEYAKGGSDFRTKGTISCWVKRSKVGVQQDIWSWGENNSSDAYLRFDTEDNIEMHCDGSGGTFNTTSLHRDVNGWYHFVFAIDGSNATANLRRRFWINGVQIDEGSGKNDISAFSASVLGWHSSQDLWIGARARSQQGGDIEYFDGLMSHFHYCCNNSYSASDFGSFDSATGEWKINASPNVQYGTHGFFLKMENSSNMDLDSSSNGHVLTTSGTLTATKDSPSNVCATLNPLVRNQTTNSYGNLRFQSPSSNWMGIPATLGVDSGKFYWEYKLTVGNAWSQCGVMSSRHNGGYNNIYSTYVGNLEGGLALNSGNGDFYHDGSSGAYGTSAWFSSGLAVGDIIGVALDATNSKIWFAQNGTWGNSSNPSTGSGGIDFSGDTDFTNYKPYLPAFSAHNCTVDVNFGNGYFGTTAVTTNSGNGYAGAEGSSIFNYQPPTNYLALSTKGLNT